MAYRIAGAERVERLLNAYDIVRSREHELSEFFWESAERIARGSILAAESILTREHLKALVLHHRAWSATTIEPGVVSKWAEERLTSVLSELESYRRSLDSAITQAETLERALGLVQDNIPEPEFRWHPRLRRDNEWHGGFAPSVFSSISLFARALDSSAHVIVDRARAVVWFEAEDVPIVLAVLSPSEFGLSVVSPDVAMRTTVSHLVPRIRLRPANFGDVLASSFGRRDVQIGAEDLDSLLHIEASPEARSILEGEPMHRNLRLLARRDVPSLIVESGLATVRWRFEPDDDSLDAALQILKNVRSRSTSCRLLRVG